jgi:hypothetical protein
MVGVDHRLYLKPCFKNNHKVLPMVNIDHMVLEIFEPNHIYLFFKRPSGHLFYIHFSMVEIGDKKEFFIYT